MLGINPYEGFEISQSGSSDTCIQLALHWLDTCSRFHQNRCGPSSSSLPTRVLDVGKSDGLDTVDRIRLISTGGRRAPYVALSHCWGPPEDAKRVKTTTTDSLDIHSQGILVAELPRNFQDAILVTRKLNIPYLWIDSLCIIQNSAPDWDKEAGKMGDYYELATITLSALCSPSSHAGFIRDRWVGDSRLDLRLENYENINIRKVGNSFGQHGSSGRSKRLPLWERAWVLQERCLSTRILHFGSEQMYWECRQCFVHEDGRRLAKSSDGASLGPGCFIPTGKRVAEKSYDRWYRLIAEYSKRGLTKEADRLPALGGIVVRFQSLLESDYLVGIWKDDLVKGLLWSRKHDGPRSRTSKDEKKHIVQRIEMASSQRVPNSSSQLPSWTWAAMGSPVVWVYVPETASPQLSVGCKGIEARVFPVGPIHLGRVSEASLKISGWLVYSPLHLVTSHRCPQGELTRFENISANALMDHVGGDITGAYFLYVANYSKTYYWLALTQCTPDDGPYRRVGILLTNKKVHDRLLEDAEEDSVTIV